MAKSCFKILSLWSFFSTLQFLKIYSFKPVVPEIKQWQLPPLNIVIATPNQSTEPGTLHTLFFCNLAAPWGRYYCHSFIREANEVPRSWVLCSRTRVGQDSKCITSLTLPATTIKPQHGQVRLRPVLAWSGGGSRGTAWRDSVPGEFS